MSTTVTYKGQTLTTVENQTKTLNTAGTWVEGDFTLTDASLDVSDTTATAPDVAQGKIFYTADGVMTTGTASAGGDELYNLIDGSITDAELDWSKITNPKDSVFRDCTALTSVDYPVIDTFRDALFRGCTNVTNIEVGVMVGNPRYAGNVMRGCTKLERATIHFHYSTRPNDTIYFAGNYFFQDDAALTTVIFDVVNSAQTRFAFSANWLFYNTSALRNLVIKFGYTAMLEGGWNANAWGGIYNNPTESTIYVPQALISSYQTATNWSNLYAAGITFAPIEGSIYE